MRGVSVPRVRPGAPNSAIGIAPIDTSAIHLDKAQMYRKNFIPDEWKRCWSIFVKGK